VVVTIEICIGWRRGSIIQNLYAFVSRRGKKLAISVFSRAPVPGNTKRRLIPALGAKGAAEIHKRMLSQVLKVASRTRQASVTLACTPSPVHPFFDGLKNEFGIPVVAQYGADLGERMSFEINRCLKTHSVAIIVGSDCPFIQREDYLLAFDALSKGTHVALGPSLDGGYYLIGLSRPLPELFKGIDWGTNQVFRSTLARIETNGYRWIRLPERADIDRPQDLTLYP